VELAVSTRVYARNSLGQFIADCKGAGSATVESLVSDGADLSRDLAPVGGKPDPRTIPLKDSIGWVMLSATSGAWFATARHALPTEFGGAPHIIEGNPGLRFYWEEAGRMWIPASDFYGQPGLVDVINHPGNPAQPYLRPAYRAMMAKAIEVADRFYPG
jgi:hypothetical protein